MSAPGLSRKPLWRGRLSGRPATPTTTVAAVGRRNHLVEGVSASGKTAVCDELLRRGHRAAHGDRDLVRRGRPGTGATGAGATDVVRRHEQHLWDVARVRALVADQADAHVFFCGGCRNWADLLDLFDVVFVLVVDLDTLERRLDQRRRDEWGARPAERDLVRRLHRSGEGVPDGVVIDATAPLAQVVDEIVRVASLVR